MLQRAGLRSYGALLERAASLAGRRAQPLSRSSWGSGGWLSAAPGGTCTVTLPAARVAASAFSSSSGGGGGSGLPAAATGPVAASSSPACPLPAPAASQDRPILDLPAKLVLLEQVAGIPQDAARQRFHMFLCGPAHHIAVRLSFLRSRGKLRSLQGLSPRLFEVICPSDEELCRLHGEDLEDLAAFKQQYLASPEWQAFCQQHAVVQAQPEGPGAGA
ncbi:hypothetical protein C2E21_8252 [Chlorella sorokiniana]|uniref:Uncharacterized protein n=1 Tax=Chlorella sorokiniana TaxID=3076 RepID=A0A2P6TF26_CHLSO|nr:hypothetical protein C2E21_8252 [Chlorella sorokiniana]|eukprot:PRW32577.1 hypothetical protein C2E21_8252 [Chlorella sorokiniana]